MRIYVLKWNRVIALLMVYQFMCNNPLVHGNGKVTNHVILARPSMKRITLLMSDVKRGNVRRHWVTWGMCGIAAGSFLYFMRNYIPFRVGQDAHAVKTASKSVSAEAGEIVSNHTMKKLLKAFQQKQLKKLLENSSILQRAKKLLRKSLEISVVVALVSWINERPLTWLSSFLDNAWHFLWNKKTSNSNSVEQLFVNVSILQSFIEMFSSDDLNETDALFYCKQVINAHYGVVRSFEQLAAHFAVCCQHDNDMYAWFIDPSNGLWNLFNQFTNQLEADLNNANIPQDIKMSSTTTTLFDAVLRNLYQCIETFKAKGLCQIAS